jgi:hypothetical protein
MFIFAGRLKLMLIVRTDVSFIKITSQELECVFTLKFFKRHLCKGAELFVVVFSRTYKYGLQKFDYIFTFYFTLPCLLKKLKILL